jgi:hypothetical protein
MTNRQYMGVLIVMMISGFVGGLMSGNIMDIRAVFAQDSGKGKVIRAKQIITESIMLQDDLGVLHGLFGFSETKDASLALVGKNRNLILSPEEGPLGGLTILDKNRKPRTILSDEGLTFFNKESDSVIGLSTQNPFISISGANGKRRILLRGYGEEKHPGLLFLFNEKGDPILELP